MCVCVCVCIYVCVYVCVFRGIDMFKDGISIPGLTMRYLFQDLDTPFALTDGRNEDLYWLIKSNIVGGPSIIFHRYHEAGLTRLREMEYGDNAKPCKTVTGFDANALYLWAISQAMPTGHPIRREAPDFKPVQTCKKGIADQWLSWVSHHQTSFHND